MVPSGPQTAPPAPDPREALAAWYLRRRHRGVWLLPLTAALVVFVGLLFLRGMAGDPQTNLRASRAALLALVPPDVPTGENAADDYALADKARVAYVQAPGSLHPYDSPKADSSRFDNPAVQTHVANNAAAIQHLYAGAAKTRCNWGVDYSLGYARPGYLSQQDDNTWLLCVHARVAAHAGDHKAAAKSCEASYKLAEHVSATPLLYCANRFSTHVECADNVVQSIVTWDTPTTLDDLAVYRKAVRQRRDPQAMAARILAGDKAFGLYTVDAVAAGAIRPRGLTESLDRLAPGKGASLLYGSERQSLRAVIDEMAASVSRGEWLTRAQARDLVARHQTGPATLALEAMSAYAWNFESFAQSEERARTIDAGLAFLQFRVTYGRDAKLLDELVPKFLAAVPTGVFHAAPLRLTVDPRGVARTDLSTGKQSWYNSGTIRIYALGPNGKDDKGYSRDGDDGHFSQHPSDDTVFRVPPMKTSAPGEKTPGKPHRVLPHEKTSAPAEKTP